MRFHVTFHHPAEFVPHSDEDGILAVGGAQWFASLLRRIPELQVDNELCQEDWGVVIYARRSQKAFWIGLSKWPEGEHTGLAHFHHGSLDRLQLISTFGRNELKRLVIDAHRILSSEPQVTDIIWYEKSEMQAARPTRFSTPCEDCP